MGNDARSTGTGGVKSVDTMFSIIETIQRRDGAGVTELAEELEISKSSVHSHLQTLMDHRCLVKEETTYRLGLRFLNFGGYVQDRNGLYKIVKPEVDRLVEETGETSQVLVEEHGRGIYLYQARGQQAVQTDSHTGTEAYLHCTATGKSVLAHLPEERVDEIIDRHGLPQRTANTVTDRDTLFEQLMEIRERDYAFDDGERIKGIRCVASPILTDDGEIVGALSLSGPMSRMTGDRFRDEIPEIVTRAARVVGINATYM